MKRKRSITYTAFNIRIHPHTSEKYVHLMERIFDLRLQIKLRGDAYGILTQIENISDNAENGMIGELAKFTKIEPGRWFNLKKLRAAEDDETRKIVIPDDLKPNFTSFKFVFSPRNHYLVIECHDAYGDINPRTLEKYFRTIFDLNEIIEEFNKIELTLIPKTDQLTSIFELPLLNHLEITIRRPNTDGLDELEEEILDRLNRQNLEEEKISLKAQPGFSINADNQTKSLAHVAQLNGEVKGSGTDLSGKKVEKSTKQYPFTEVGQYIPGEISSGDFLLVMADRIISKVRSIKRPTNESDQ